MKYTLNKHIFHNLSFLSSFSLSIINIYIVITLSANIKVEAEPPVQVPVGYSPLAGYGPSFSQITWQQQMVRAKQQEQQKLLNLQYKIQQQKEQYQMRQELELKRMREELLQEKKLLKVQTEHLIPELDYANQVPVVTFREPFSVKHEVPTFVQDIEAAADVASEYGPPSLVETAEYGPPAAVVESQSHTGQNEPNIACDEREAIGQTRIVSVKTSHGAICKVTLQAFGRCPGTEPVSVLVDSIDPENPEACKGVEKILRAKQFVSRIPGHVLGVAQFLVDSYDTVKDFYRDLFHQKHHDNQIHAHAAYSTHEEIGGY